MKPRAFSDARYFESLWAGKPAEVKQMQFSKDDGHVYDVVAVSLDDNSILWVDEKKSLPNAEAVVAMAVMRQGVEDRFFSPTPTGTYKAGDKWTGNHMPEREPEPHDPDAHIVIGNMAYPNGPRGL